MAVDKDLEAFVDFLQERGVPVLQIQGDLANFDPSPASSVTGLGEGILSGDDGGSDLAAAAAAAAAAAPGADAQQVAKKAIVSTFLRHVNDFTHKPLDGGTGAGGGEDRLEGHIQEQQFHHQQQRQMGGVSEHLQQHDQGHKVVGDNAVQEDITDTLQQQNAFMMSHHHQESEQSNSERFHHYHHQQQPPALPPALPPPQPQQNEQQSRQLYQAPQTSSPHQQHQHQQQHDATLGRTPSVALSAPVSSTAVTTSTPQTQAATGPSKASDTNLAVVVVAKVSSALRHCDYKDCTRRPSFNFSGLRARFCSTHKETTMVDVAHKTRCQHPGGCPKHPGYGFPRSKPSHCASHRLQGMVDLKRGRRLPTPGSRSMESAAAAHAAATAAAAAGKHIQRFAPARDGGGGGLAEWGRDLGGRGLGTGNLVVGADGRMIELGEGGPGSAHERQHEKQEHREGREEDHGSSAPHHEVTVSASLYHGFGDGGRGVGLGGESVTEGGMEMHAQNDGHHQQQQQQQQRHNSADAARQECMNSSSSSSSNNNNNNNNNNHSHDGVEFTAQSTDMAGVMDVVGANGHMSHVMDSMISVPIGAADAPGVTIDHLGNPDGVIDPEDMRIIAVGGRGNGIEGDFERLGGEGIGADGTFLGEGGGAVEMIGLDAGVGEGSEIPRKRGKKRQWPTTPCEDAHCFKSPSYGPRGMLAVRCAGHKTEMDVYVKNHCLFLGCTKVGSFGEAGGRPSYCRAHKWTHMIDVKSKVCESKNCGRRSSFGEAGKSARFCSNHRPKQMVDVVHRRCEFPHCEKHPTYGFPGQKRRFCSVHVLAGMVDLLKTKNGTLPGDVHMGGGVVHPGGHTGVSDGGSGVSFDVGQ